MMNYCNLKHQQQWLHQTTQLTGIQSSDMGLVQAIADNFDANITSSNGLNKVKPCFGPTDDTGMSKQ